MCNPSYQLLWSSQPSPSILYFNITPQQFLAYQRCDLKSYSCTKSNTLFFRNPSSRLSQAMFLVGVFCAVNLTEMSSKSTGCLLPLQKSGADLLRKAAPRSGSNAKQPLPPVAAAAPLPPLLLPHLSWHCRPGGGAASLCCMSCGQSDAPVSDGRPDSDLTSVHDLAINGKVLRRCGLRGQARG